MHVGDRVGGMKVELAPSPLENKNWHAEPCQCHFLLSYSRRPTALRWLALRHRKNGAPGAIRTPDPQIRRVLELVPRTSHNILTTLYFLVLSFPRVPAMFRSISTQKLPWVALCDGAGMDLKPVGLTDAKIRGLAPERVLQLGNTQARAAPGQPLPVCLVPPSRQTADRR